MKQSLLTSKQIFEQAGVSGLLVPLLIYLAKVGFKSGKLMTWPSLSPELHPIENFCLLKRKLYTGGKQYASKDELWDSILQSAQSIGAEEIENLTKSADNRLVKVLSNNGNHVNM